MVLARSQKRKVTGHLPKMPEHHGCAQNHGSGVSLVGTHDILSDVTAARLEKSIFLEQL